MQAVIVSFDSLAANSLGCYGNDWVETPNWDRLAATGVVFDRHFADAVGSPAGMAWATGRHSLCLIEELGCDRLSKTPVFHGAVASSQPLVAVSLGSCLSSNGIATQLVTVSEHAAWHRSAEFGKSTTVSGREGFDAKPDEVPFAQVVKAALAAWNDVTFQKCPRLLWLHSPGPGRPPEGFESLYFEDFEERGVNIAELPDDERQRHPAVYGGAVSLLDHWLGELLTGIGTTPEPTLIIVTAAQGYMCQQTSSFLSDTPQDAGSVLTDQRIRTPLVLNVIGDNRFEQISSLRSNRLVQTVDLVPTLMDWFGIKQTSNDSQTAGQSWLRECIGEVPARRFLRIGDCNGNDAVRTPEWLLVHETRPNGSTDSSISNSHQVVSLYAKPEDIWDVNNIASQQPDVVGELMQYIP